MNISERATLLAARTARREQAKDRAGLLRTPAPPNLQKSSLECLDLLDDAARANLLREIVADAKRQANTATEVRTALRQLRKATDDQVQIEMWLRAARKHVEPRCTALWWVLQHTPNLKSTSSPTQWHKAIDEAEVAWPHGNGPIQQGGLSANARMARSITALIPDATVREIAQALGQKFKNDTERERGDALDECTTPTYRRAQRVLQLVKSEILP